jgi:hypothetical protein
LGGVGAFFCYKYFALTGLKKTQFIDNQVINHIYILLS